MAQDAKKIAAPKWQDLHLLIVSQDDEFRFWARTVFRKFKAADVFSTPTGSEALHILKTSAADVILLDLFREPKLGVRFVQHLRAVEQFAGIPVILFIQSGDEARVRTACQAGIQNVIRKPVAEGDMVKRVAATIADPRPLVWTDAYVGKERRAGNPNFKGPDRRVAKPESSPVKAKTAPAPPAAKPAPPRKAPPPARPARAAPEVEDSADLEAAEAARLARQRELEDELAVPPPAAKPARSDEVIETRDAPKTAAPARSNDDWEEALGPDPKDRDAPAEPGIDVPQTLRDHAVWLETRGKEGARAQLQGKDLSGANLAEADLSNANLRGTDLSGADCSRANFEGADLRQAVLSGARSQGANLYHAKLRHADLRGCDLRGANLRDSDLAGANLGGALLAAADLGGANLLHTDLAGAARRSNGATPSAVGQGARRCADQVAGRPSHRG